MIQRLWFVEWIIKRSKHLVLPDIGRHVSVPISQPPKSLDHRLRFNLFTVSVIFQALTSAPPANLLPPVADLIQRLMGGFLRQEFKHLFEDLASIPHNRDISSHGFRNGSRINIDMQNSGIWAVLCQIVRWSGLSNLTPTAKITSALCISYIGFVGTVHSQHAQCLTMRCRKRPQPHQ